MNDKVFDIIYLAKQKGIEFAVITDQLQLKLPKNHSVEEDLLEEIRKNKSSIIEFLGKHKKNYDNGVVISKCDRNSYQRIPLSFSQERLWFIDQLEGSLQYHIPVIHRLKGKLNVDALTFALSNIINRHEVLRTVLTAVDGDAFQTIKEKPIWQLDVVDGDKYREDAATLQQVIISLIQQPYNLSEDNMLRASLIKLTPIEHVLVIAIHHIAFDGWSVSILIKELVEFYNSYIFNRHVQLEPLTVQYADYAIWQRQYLQGEALDKKLSYWKDKLTDIIPLELPLDYPRPAIQSKRCRSKL